MGKILQFPAKRPPKFGFERVKKHSGEDREQLTLFPPRPAEVRRLPVNMSPFEEALLLDERGDSRAGAAYLRAIAEGDLVADAYCNLGVIESGAGRTSKAFDCFTKALEQDPRHFEAHYNLANLYFEAGDLRLARMHYDLAAEINPGFPNLYFNLGLVLALLEEKKAAIGALAKYQLLAAPEEREVADDLICELRRSLGGVNRDTGR